MSQNTFCSKCHRTPNQCCCISAPRELSDEEIEEIGEHVFGNCFLDFEVADNYLDFARAILKKASEK